MIKVRTMDPEKNVLVTCGFIDETTFIRNVKPEHFMRVVGGYGIQEAVFDALKDRKITDIILQVEGSGTKWLSKLDDWIAHGKVANYGHGRQRFLSTSYMCHPEQNASTVSLNE